MRATLLLSLAMMAALFLMIWAAVALVQSPKLFTSAPKDIQAAIKERRERFPGARALGWLVLALCALAFPGAFILAGWDGAARGYGFWGFAGRFLVMLWLLKVFDVVVLDWFLLTKTRFYQHYYPETEGCEGYGRFGFNRREQLVQAALAPLLAAAMAGVCAAL